MALRPLPQEKRGLRPYYPSSAVFLAPLAGPSTALHPLPQALPRLRAYLAGVSCFRSRRIFTALAYNEAMAAPGDSKPEPVNQLTYASSSTPEARWVLLGKYIPLEAQLIQAKLEAEGIPCNLADQNMAQMYSALIGIDVRLEVLDHDLERARAILEAARATRATDAEDEPYLDEDWRCSKCRSRNVGYVPLGNLLFGLSLLMLGLPLVFIKRYKRCKDCGH